MHVTSLRTAMIGLILAGSAGMTSLPSLANEPTNPSESAPVKVVYHVNEGVQQASRAVGNIRNHLKAEPNVKIVVVTHGQGIDFLLKDAENAAGAPFEPSIQELVAQGVEFRVCNNTLNSRKLSAESVIPEARIVPSGVAEVARIQSREGYTYLKP